MRLTWLDNEFRKGLYFYAPLTKNKYFELEAVKSTNWYYYFSLSVTWDRKVDHAGVGFSVNFGPLELDVNVSDERHWNYETDTWMTPKEMNNVSKN